MAEYVHETVAPVYENTTMEKLYIDGVHKRYYIAAVDGYVLHDKANDWTDMNPETMEETYMLGYARGTVSCAANYDFVANPREFYAVPEDSVPADQIFGLPGNDHVTA